MASGSSEVITTRPIPGSSSATGSAGIPSLVTLTTDFGTGSPYVAAMKAVLLAGCAEARLIDVSHEVPVFDTAAGAFVLWAGTRGFESGAVHLAVVDPGVGGARRAVAFGLGGSFYVGPDNGLFSYVLEAAEGPVAVVELRRPEAASPTFEGRDVFAPAAARLAAGEGLGELGPPARDLKQLTADWSRVLWVDRFGNLVTSLRPPVAGVRVRGREVRLAAPTYSAAPAWEPFHYVGSMGFVEVAVREGRADVLLGAGAGDPVEAL